MCRICMTPSHGKDSCPTFRTFTGECGRAVLSAPLGATLIEVPDNVAMYMRVGGPGQLPDSAWPSQQDIERVDVVIGDTAEGRVTTQDITSNTGSVGNRTYRDGMLTLIEGKKHLLIPSLEEENRSHIPARVQSSLMGTRPSECPITGDGEHVWADYQDLSKLDDPDNPDEERCIFCEKIRSR